MDSFQIGINFESEHVVLALQGRLNRDTTGVLGTVMDTLVDAVSGIVFDFGGLYAVDDRGIDGLETCMRAAISSGYRIGVRNTGRDDAGMADRYGLGDLVTEKLVGDR